MQQPATTIIKQQTFANGANDKLRPGVRSRDRSGQVSLYRSGQAPAGVLNLRVRCCISACRDYHGFSKSGLPRSKKLSKQAFSIPLMRRGTKRVSPTRACLANPNVSGLCEFFTIRKRANHANL